jgi:uncharacterized membrane protein
MTDATDRARALRAEKQVEQLERELELVKSRLKVNCFLCFTLNNELTLIQ